MREVTRALLIAAVIAIVTVVVNSASKADVESLLTEHSRHPHPSTAEELRAVRARIDLMMVHDLDDPERRERMRPKADEIRREARQRGERDPLSGMEGL